jgi:DNA invertase Pin-like site-specific DNA recombinase
MRVALYLRVSTGEQTVENQDVALRAIAAARGWQIVETYRDEGISGAKGRDRRPGFDLMWKDAARRKFDLVAAWSVDRLGRSLADVAAFMVDMRAYGVDLYLDKQAVDTTTPSGRALLQMAGVFAEFEREMIRERTIAGQKRARDAGARFGRPTIPAAKEEAISADLKTGLGVVKLAKTHGVGVSVVQRLKAALIQLGLPRERLHAEAKDLTWIASEVHGESQLMPLVANAMARALEPVDLSDCATCSATIWKAVRT